LDRRRLNDGAARYRRVRLFSRRPRKIELRPNIRTANANGVELQSVP
jgi:hypothetical protein